MDHTGSFQQSPSKNNSLGAAGMDEEAKRYTFNPNDYQEFRRMALQKEQQNIFGGEERSFEAQMNSG